MAALTMAAAMLCVPSVEAQTPPATQSARPALVLACHDQSEPCKTWRSQWQPLFAASPAYKMIDIRTIGAPTAKAMMQPAAWPADLRWLLDTFLMSQQGAWERSTRRRASSCCRMARSRPAPPATTAGAISCGRRSST